MLLEQHYQTAPNFTIKVIQLLEKTLSYIIFHNYFIYVANYELSVAFIWIHNFLFATHILQH